MLFLKIQFTREYHYIKCNFLSYNKQGQTQTFDISVAKKKWNKLYYCIYQKDEIFTCKALQQISLSKFISCEWLKVRLNILG